VERERIPQHKKLYDILRNHIAKGLYTEGSLLPSENELCSIHDVTRPTVRQALARLVNEGYIVKHQGKGSIVKTPPKGIGILSLQGTTTGVGKHNLETIPLGKPQVMPWPEPFMFDLSTSEKESGCIMLERRRIVDGEPILYDISYLPNINLTRFTQRSFVNKSLFAVLRSEYGIEVHSGEQKIQAVPADHNISRHLNVASGSPVLHLQRKMATNRPAFFFYSSIYCNTTDYYLEGTF
jgi:GntR family transcriptional regulator/GntR family frlABCD operon transcriptional regulator